MGKKEKYKRYISVEQSIIGALKEVREMQAGRLPKQTLEEFFAELNAEIRAEEKKMSKKLKREGLY